MNDKGQMFLLTGVMVVLLTIVAASMSSQLSNINVERSTKANSMLLDEFRNVQEIFFKKLDKEGGIATAGLLENISSEIEIMESKYGIHFQATLGGSGGFDPTVILTLQDDNTVISKEFDT